MNTSDALPDPRVSVVMPVYNGTRFIRPTIESILAQDFRDFECIIVDDGSTDGTQEILAEYAEKDTRIKVHLLQHAGKVTAFNTGFRHARGEFIAINCADDISFRQRFSTEVRYLEEHPSVAVVGSWVELIDAEGAVTGLLKHVADPALVEWRMLFRNPVADSSAMLRRSVVEEFGFYKETASEDYELLSRISGKYDIANIPTALGQYRIWQGNFTSLHGAEEEETVYEVIREKASALLQEDVSDREARALRLPVAGRKDMTLADMQIAAALLSRIVRAFLRHRPMTAAIRQIVRDDTSDYFFLLARAAAKHSLVLSLRLRLRAFSGNPLFVLHILKQRMGGKSEAK